MAPPPILLSVRTSQLPPQHTHTSCSSCLQEVLEWKMQVHIDQQTEWNGEKQSITPILYMYLIFSVLYRLWYTHTHQRYWYVCAFQSSPHCCEHGYWTSAIKYNQSRYCNRYARPKRSFQIYDFFSCIFRLEFSCVVYSHEYMHILTIDRLVCKENCRSWWLVLSVEWMRKFCYFGITLPFLV